MGDRVKPVYIVAGGLVAAAAAYVLYRKASSVGDSLVESAQDAAWAVTPWNPDNIFYGGVNTAGAAVTGNKDFTLGGAAYDATHKPDGSFDWTYLQTLTPAGAISWTAKKLFG